MKFRTIIFCLLGLSFASCEDYLDKSPDMDMTDSVIYKDYESLRGFLDQIFNGFFDTGKNCFAHFVHSVTFVQIP